ncbi:MAG: FliG C-terminal domain-containing protein [Bacteroidota bacterium]
MKAICFYFQVHQPFRLRTYRFFDIGVNHHYYDDYANRYILRRVADKCYIPANNIILNLIKEFGSSFKVSYSISGTALDQFEMYTPDVLESFQRLAETGCVEFLAETYSHSLSALKSKDEFIRQVDEHSVKIERLFGRKPTTFRNTELIYSDSIGEMVAEMGFKTMLTEGAKHMLGWKSPNYMYYNSVNPKLKLLLKNFRLSDDIAFRFSQTSWSEWPVTTEKYVDWLNNIDGREECVNLFMDYETFGEHQWPETGIFDFLKALPARVFSNSTFKFHTPSELSELLQPVSPVHVQYPISWADEERDLTAWLGNDLQDDAFNRLYELEEKVYRCKDENILRDWKYLQTSDHFYYMCTKWFSDGDVHKYFNPYNTPYEAFINFMNILSDFLIRINEICPDTRVIHTAHEEKKDVMAIIEELKKEVLHDKKTNKEKQIEKKSVIKKPVTKKSKSSVKSITSKKTAKRKEVKVRGNELKLLSSIAKPAMKLIFGDYDLKVLAMALVSAGDELTDKVRSSIGQSSGRKLRTALNRITSPKSKEVKEARRKMEERIKKYFASLKK